MALTPDTTKLQYFLKNYWGYYLELEKELVEINRYVSFSINNKKTYSIEFLKLYVAACSEIDVVAKAIAHELDNTFKMEDKNDIFKWWYIVQTWNNENTATCLQKLTFYDEYDIEPWAGFSVEKKSHTSPTGTPYDKIELCAGSKTPLWWSAYNKVKHARTVIDGNNGSNFQKACLENVSAAFAALFVLEKHYLIDLATEEQINRIPKSVLFEKKEVNVSTVDDHTIKMENKPMLISG